MSLILLASKLSICLTLFGCVRLLFTSSENVANKRKCIRDTGTLLTCRFFRVASDNSVCPFLGNRLGGKVRSVILGASKSPNRSPLCNYYSEVKVKMIRLIFLSTYQLELEVFVEDFELDSFNLREHLGLY